MNFVYINHKRWIYKPDQRNFFFPISITRRFYRYIITQTDGTHLDVRYRFVSTYYANIYVFISTLYLYSCVIFHLVGFLYSILQDISFSMKAHYGKPFDNYSIHRIDFN